jgi:hypothetical protein
MVGYQNASLYKIDHPCRVSLRQAHLQHQTTDAMAPDAPTVATQMPRHLSRAVPGRLQELLIDETHQHQVLGALRHGLAVER